MPELPEVETTKRKLEPLLIGERILGFWTDWPRGLKISSKKFTNVDIKGRKISKIERRGKAIIMELSGGRILGMHQRMSGKILVLPRAIQDKHTHFRFKLSNGRDLVMHDIRKFGLVWYGAPRNVLNDKYLMSLGHDPLVISLADFKKSFRRKSGMIKPLLLRQDILAGIGNIIADESLWKAKIHPKTRIEQLRETKIINLYKSIRFVLNKSIKLGGTTMRDWLHPDKTEGRYFAECFVYQRAGERCFRCRTLITRIVVGSRGTFFCPKCQPMPQI